MAKILRDDQKEHRVMICRGLLERLEIDPNHTDDESWILEYDPEIKWENAHRDKITSSSIKKDQHE